jgi:hypothetical protein
MKKISESAKNFLKDITTDSLYLVKIIAPFMLIVSFILVIHGWFEIKSNQILSEHFRSALAVPLILFGVMAIMNVMLFVESGACMFLAVFFIGTVVSGPEIAEKGAKIAAATFSKTAAQYADVLGGIGSPNYSEGGLADEETTKNKDAKTEILEDHKKTKENSSLNTAQNATEEEENETKTSKTKH